MPFPGAPNAYQSFFILRTSLKMVLIPSCPSNISTVGFFDLCLFSSFREGSSDSKVFSFSLRIDNIFSGSVAL